MVIVAHFLSFSWILEPTSAVQLTVHSEPMKNHHPRLCPAAQRATLHLDEVLPLHRDKAEEEDVVVAPGFHRYLLVEVVVFALAAVDCDVTVDSPSAASSAEESSGEGLLMSEFGGS